MAIQLMHYTDAQILTKVDSMFEKSPMNEEFVPLQCIEVLK